MVKHIVFWKLKSAGAGRAQGAQRIKALLESLRGRVEGMRHLEVGINFEASDAAWDVALYCEFDSRSALDAYQDHPAHVAVKGEIGALRESRAVVDYEL